RQEGRITRYHILSMNAYERHKKMVNDYLMYYGGRKTEFQRDSSLDKRDIDVVREHHQFLWDEEEEDEANEEKRLAKKYHDKLFKEYCIADLSRYKENKIAMRWRIEKELVAGKGQFTCGNKKCEETESLKTWEVNFGYLEHGVKKNALVKLRLCPECSIKLNYKNKRKEVTKKKRKTEDKDEKEKKKKKKKGEELGQYNDKAEASTSADDKDGKNLWAGPAPVTEDKSRDEEFEDYFTDMFL
ncbi:hypothetical protein CAPTEDRAFT_127161, partial [Capitella teleta]